MQIFGSLKVASRTRGERPQVRDRQADVSQEGVPGRGRQPRPLESFFSEASERRRLERGALPLHPAEVPGPENDEPKGNSVPGENLEIVAADIAYQGAHGERRAHEGCNRTDPDDREIVEFDRVPRFEEFQYRCAEYRRNRQEK